MRPPIFSLDAQHLTTLRGFVAAAATIVLVATVDAAVWNVRDFGAKGDGTTKDTEALQHALDACAVAGGGQVRIPAGRYLIGSVQIGQHTELHLEDGAVLAGSPSLDDYPMVEVRWEGRLQPGHCALLHAAHVDHIAITGSGQVEGNAEAAAPQNPRGSVVIETTHCSDVRIECITVSQGGNWAIHPVFCEDVIARGVTIRGKRDGIDVDSCSRVRIEHCDIETGDDCISLKSGRGLDGARLGRPTEDVTITDCDLKGGYFAAIGIGSEVSGGIRHVRIDHCRLTARTFAIYLKSRVGRGGCIGNLDASDLDVSGGGFLRINLASAGNENTANDPVPGEPGYTPASKLSFSNIRLHDVGTAVRADQIPPEHPVDGLSLENLSGTAKSGITLAHARFVTLQDISISVAEGPPLTKDDVTETTVWKAP